MSSHDQSKPAPRGNRRGAPRRSSRRTDAPVVRRGTVRLPHDVARRIRAGHPWVYREALRERVMREAPGAPIELVDHDGDFVGHGFLDGDTAIAVRVMSRDPKTRASPELAAERVVSAIGFRRRLMDFDRNHALRLVNGESDGLPGVAIDRYGDYLVAQLFTPAVLGYREAIYEALERELSPVAIYEQQRFKSLAGDAPHKGAELVRGRAAPVELEVREGELRFWVDVTAPLSTGLFSDLREGRGAVTQWAKGRRVLNLFSYTGAISVCAAHGGAAEVTAIDVAAKAHARARKNFALNGFDPEKPEHIVGDAFKVIARFADRGRNFDMVVIDPPAFASAGRGGQPWVANKDYSELVSAALTVLAPGGVFCAASATHKLSAPDFDAAMAQGAARADTSLRVVDRRSLPVDFPTSPGFPESNYLKFAVAIRG